jgi:hypothetical protein
MHEVLFTSQGDPMRVQLFVGALALLGLMASSSQTAETTKEKDAAKTALQNFHEFIGAWNGNGETKGGKSEFWKEGMNWGWKFAKDGSASLQVEFKDNKSFDKGEMKYVPDKKKYQLTIVDKDKKERVFEGEVKQKRLILTRVDDKSMDKYTISMFSTNEGALFKLEYKVQTGGRGLDKTLYEVNSKKEGVSISGGKKNECIVSGGVGTMAVSFGGKTYYVCCSGCRDAFNENPKKFVDEYEKKKK